MVNCGEFFLLKLPMSKALICDPEILEDGKNKWKLHKNICYEITTELQSCPCSYIYEQPIECQTSDSPKMLSFPIILKNISDDVYTELKEWMFDMKLLFITPCKGHKTSGEMAIGYDYIQRLMKKVKRFNLTTFKGWSKTIKSYNLKIESLLQTAPPIARSHFPLTIPPIEYTTKRIGPAQIEYILKNYHRIQRPNDIHSILNIVRLDVNGCEPKDGLLDIDLFKLSVPTRCKIYDFMRYKFKEDEEDHSLKM